MSPKGKSVTAYLEQLVECSITGTTDDILRTCSVIASAKDALSADDFRSLRDRAPITDKVWSKLLQIGLDTRLEDLKESLPPKWSTIYLIHNLTDEELKDAMDDGAIHPQVSQGTFNRYLKEKRFQGLPKGRHGTSSHWFKSSSQTTLKRKRWIASRVIWTSWSPSMGSRPTTKETPVRSP